MDVGHTPVRYRGESQDSGYMLRPDVYRRNEFEASENNGDGNGSPTRRHGKHRSSSSTFSDLMPRADHEPSPPSPPKSHARLRIKRSIPIILDEPRRVRTVDRPQPATMPSRSPHTVSPQRHQQAQFFPDDSSSIYSQDREESPMRVNPLQIPNKKASRGDTQASTAAFIEAYGDREWEDLTHSTASPNHGRAVHRSRSYHELAQPASKLDFSVPEDLGREPQPSPLAPYFADKDFPVVRKGGKVMIGDNGWLERTGSPPAKKGKESPPKRQGFLDSIKKMAKDMVKE
jgi:hypothetical protein